MLALLSKKKNAIDMNLIYIIQRDKNRHEKYKQFVAFIYIIFKSLCILIKFCDELRVCFHVAFHCFLR